MEERSMDLGWHGMLTVNNVEQVADLLRQLLTGKRYTFVAVNEFYGFKPEVRTSQKLKPKINSSNPINVYYDDTGAKRFAGFSVSDSYGVWSFSTNLQEDQDDPGSKNPHFSFEWDKVTIIFRLSGGNLVYWVAAVEKENGPKLDSWEKPQFGLGSHVWVISGINAKESKVVAINFRLIDDTGQSNLICTGYRLNIYNLDLGDFSFSPQEVYATEKEARELAQWHPVLELSEIEWAAAIGNRDFPIELCELPACCGNISDARNILFKCRKDGGLIERDARELKELLGNHSLPLPKKESINLNKILEQLELSSLFN